MGGSEMDAFRDWLQLSLRTARNEVAGCTRGPSPHGGQPFRTHAPKSFFHVCTYSAHQSSLQSVSAQPHVASILQTIVSYRLYSSGPQASPSNPAIAVAVPGWRISPRRASVPATMRSTARAARKAVIALRWQGKMAEETMELVHC